MTKAALNPWDKILSDDALDKSIEEAERHHAEWKDALRQLRNELKRRQAVKKQEEMT